MRKLVFDPTALEDLLWWVQQDRRKAVRILSWYKCSNVILLGAKESLSRLSTSWQAAGRDGSIKSIALFIRSWRPS